MSDCPQPETRAPTQILLCAFFSKLGFIFLQVCSSMAEESKHPVAKDELNLNLKPVVDRLFFVNH